MRDQRATRAETGCAGTSPPGPAQLGVYEKTIPAHHDWTQTFTDVRAAGFDFLELSIDVSSERLARLTWDARKREQVRAAASDQGCEIRVLTLSAHREAPWGSADPLTRLRATELAHRTIDLAADLGAECVQIAGYFTFDGPRAANARDLFLDGLRDSARRAASSSLLLAIENVDGQDVTSVSDGLGLLRDLGEPNVQLYVDVGNLAGNRRDTLEELRRALPNTYCVQLKDARPGEFRRVPFGEGAVPFDGVFDILVENPDLPVSVEMWNDDGDPALAPRAAQWVRAEWALACARLREKGRMDDNARR